MRVAPVAWYAQSLDKCLTLAKTTAEVTHNSEEGVHGAQAVAAAIFLNRTGKSKADIKSYIEQTLGYNLSRTTDEIRPTYAFETACDKSVPESIICFLEAENYMDAVIRAISLGGDTDTRPAWPATLQQPPCQSPKTSPSTVTINSPRNSARSSTGGINCHMYNKRGLFQAKRTYLWYEKDD